jgi:hypothetical protein
LKPVLLHEIVLKWFQERRREAGGTGHYNGNLDC